MLDLTAYPTAALYGLLAVITAGTGVAIIVYQTVATQRALLTRRGLLAAGVLLILLAGLVLLTQVLAVVGGSYGG